MRFSVLFILLNIGVYWITGAQKTRYIIMFVPFIMTIISYLYWQAEKQAAEKLDKYIKYTGLFFCLGFVSLLALPFFVEVGWWKVLPFACTLLVFLIIFFRARQYRLWLFITGFVLIRLIYATIGLPVKGQKEFDYQQLAKGIVLKSNHQPVYYWGQPDTPVLDRKSVV